jgi:SAM-dependent methyltransferase
VLRFLLRHAVGLDVVGIDVDPTSVEWCRHNLPFGTFYVNAEEPPTALPDSRFGFAYAISVFSHLSEANQHAWLRELARVMRDGALLVITVHGRRALNRAAKEEKVLRMLEISPADLASAQSDVERRGIAFISQPEGHLNRALYGISFVTEEYARRSWTSAFECVGYESGALDDWQDAIVLRRTAGFA